MTEKLTELKRLVDELKMGGYIESKHGFILLSEIIFHLVSDIAILETMYRELNPIITKQDLDEFARDYK